MKSRNAEENLPSAWLLINKQVTLLRCVISHSKNGLNRSFWMFIFCLSRQRVTHSSFIISHRTVQMGTIPIFQEQRTEEQLGNERCRTLHKGLMFAKAVAHCAQWNEIMSRLFRGIWILFSIFLSRSTPVLGSNGNINKSNEIKTTARKKVQCLIHFCKM